MAGDRNVTQGFRFSRDDARTAFPGVAPRRIVLAVLATVQPRQEWSGCRVFLESPWQGDAGSVGVHVDGDAARVVAEELGGAFPRLGIPVRERLSERPTEAAELLVRAGDGRWV